MKQKYLYLFLIMSFLLLGSPVSAQVTTQAANQANPMEEPIEGLSVYPNPASGDKVYITSKKNKPKVVEIYNVLGKPIHSARVNGKELDITPLEPGIYIMKIKEGSSTATRKLVIRG